MSESDYEKCVNQYIDEQIGKKILDMAMDEGLRCTECGRFLAEGEHELEPMTHVYAHIIIEEGEYGEPDTIHILCDECYKKWVSGVIE